MPIPALKRRPWYVREVWPSVVGLAVVVTGGIGSITREAFSAHRNVLQLSLIAAGLAGGLFLGAVKVAQSRFKDAKEDKKESPDDLRGCLHVIHGTVAGLKMVATPPSGWLRITFHKVDGAMLEQSVHYVGSEDRGAGRRFTIHAGVIGRVAREGEPQTFDRPADMSFEDWAHYLVSDLGMVREDAWNTRKDRFSFLGVPIKSPGGEHVRGVVYLDAQSPGFFDEETIGVVLDGCGGLASWIDEHYYSSKT